jgi:CHAT domain
MKRSRKGVIRLVLDTWRDRGWSNEGDAAFSVVTRLGELGGYDRSIAEVLPRSFLVRNSISRDEAAQELERVLADIEIDEAVHQSNAPRRLKILFFAANPRDQPTLALDEEAREVEERIRKTEHRDVIDLRTKWAVRPSDLIEALNRERPQIIHFSGHGSASDELVFQDDFGGTKLVSKEALSATISTVSDEVRLVLFNNCFSEEHAREAVNHVEAAIGMNTSISDDAARIFAAEFYAALGYGRSVKTSFDQAKASLMLEGLPEDQTPQLFTRRDVDPTALVLVAAE